MTGEDNPDRVEVSLDRKRWAEVLIALAKAKDDEDAEQAVRDRWEEAGEQIKEQVSITGLDLIELQEEVYNDV